MGLNPDYLLKSFLLYYAMDDNKNAPLEWILPHCAGMPVGPLAPPNFWPFLLLATPNLLIFRRARFSIPIISHLKRLGLNILAVEFFFFFFNHIWLKILILN